MRHSKKWIDSGPEEPVWQIASRVLESRLERLWNFLGRAVREPASETENVHQLRVFTRRSTAALEIFEPWLPAQRGRKVRKRVSKVRKAAGAARDLDVLRLRLQTRLEQAPSNNTSLLLEHVRHCTSIWSRGVSIASFASSSNALAAQARPRIATSVSTTWPVRNWRKWFCPIWKLPVLK
jgi:hypothetical protein